MMENGMSPADVMAMTNNDGWGNGSWLWFILVFFGLFNGYGWGGNRADNAQIAYESINANMQRGFDVQTVNGKLEAMQLAQESNSKENAILINNNTFENYKAINNLSMAMQNGFNGVNANITDVGYQLQNVGCSINRNIDAVRYENAQNTCAITNAIHQEGELTRGLIQANVVQDLRDRLEEKDRLYQAANFQISQNAQTANILGNLGRWVGNPPVPCCPYIAGTTIA